MAPAKVHPVFPLLVVSLDASDHRSLDGMLRQDCHLYQAQGVSQAVREFRRFRPWVIICDQNLADGDWRDLLTGLQSVENAPPLIVASRLADDRLWAEVLNLGGYDLLTKPFTAAEVHQVVKMAARRGMTETV